MSRIPPAPAAPGNRAPTQPPSLRRPPPANVPRIPQPINRRPGLDAQADQLTALRAVMQRTGDRA